jgi:hypothetical protein
VPYDVTAPASRDSFAFSSVETVVMRARADLRDLRQQEADARRLACEAPGRQH